MEATIEAEQSAAGDRRENKFRFDKNINISAVIAGLVILWTVVTYGNALINQGHDTNKKVSIMWNEFTKTRPDLQNLFDRP